MQSTLAPASVRTQKPVRVGKNVVMAGRETCGRRRICQSAAAIVAPEFPARARAKGGGFIVGGGNYGQGSSREHAAIAPMYLGVVGVIVKDFARIHLANLINWGIVPMTFANPADQEKVRQGDLLEIPGIRRLVEGGAEKVVVNNLTQKTTFTVALSLNRRERDYVLAGGRLAHTKAHPIA